MVIKDKMAIPLSLLFYLRLPTFYFLPFTSNFSLTTGKEEFSIRLPHTSLCLDERMTLTLMSSTTCCRRYLGQAWQYRSFRIVWFFCFVFFWGGNHSFKSLSGRDTVCYSFDWFVLNRTKRKFRNEMRENAWRDMKYIQFPVIMNMGLYHYLINWEPIDRDW